MDPRDRADAVLARARARGLHVVTPDNMTSPMDSSATQQIPRSVVAAVDPRGLDPDSTMVLSARTAAGQPPQAAPAPQQPGQQQPGQQQAGQQQPGQPQPVRAQAPQQQPGQPQKPAAPQRKEQPVQGLVPTVQQTDTGRPSLSQRLNGSAEPNRQNTLSQRLSGDV
ncbi:hypothetical protein [Umezawaea beigongshangensis]|uniref:hypothetical protein n=1 Tax=Umezawaea beigongshangensis TaxID=2780383 RepID=UPI0018F1465E|nr:hypothetical protein [Umezawaea beigongshangensis]